MVEQLPLLPAAKNRSGDQWAARLTGGWRVVPTGREDTNLGERPPIVMAHFDGVAIFGLATYCKGTVQIEEFSTRRERDLQTDRLAASLSAAGGHAGKLIGLDADGSGRPELSSRGYSDLQNDRL